ncbi:hypothetical protein DL89DRAFT_265143 [Linderina pennispora]|uniref:SCP domain-containing protein n=1 Tax=Linderina pennispora TaxID=61395 RepID=A0A1Y1WHD8_9FUNG|nr:uncharacterized protein DL89DRAFT_265143 [Linderina pennispora]ORX72981.1 hypothetical protein DL89DRAFT_265143 [Linderina pennispora]
MVRLINQLLLASFAPSITGLYAGLPEDRGSRDVKPHPIKHVGSSRDMFLAGDWRSDMLRMVNSQRAMRSLPALIANDLLNAAAQNHSNYQYSVQTMTHQDPAGSLGDRITATGLRWTNAGENVAWNQKTPAEAMDSWVNSPHHLANILGNFNVAGFGEQGLYWTQIFALIS